jgi:hypothetical protein
MTKTMDDLCVNTIRTLSMDVIVTGVLLRFEASSGR